MIDFPYAKRPSKGTLVSWVGSQLFVRVGKTESKCNPDIVEFYDANPE